MEYPNVSKHNSTFGCSKRPWFWHIHPKEDRIPSAGASLLSVYRQRMDLRCARLAGCRVQRLVLKEEGWMNTNLEKLGVVKTCKNILGWLSHWVQSRQVVPDSIPNQTMFQRMRPPALIQSIKQFFESSHDSLVMKPAKGNQYFDGSPPDLKVVA